MDGCRVVKAPDLRGHRRPEHIGGYQARDGREHKGGALRQIARQLAVEITKLTVTVAGDVDVDIFKIVDASAAYPN